MKKIAITGPECSGKTTLAVALAERLELSWIPEYARKYLNELDGDYNQNDLDAIAKQQQEFIDLYQKTDNNYLITDTEMLVMKIWSQEKFGTVTPLIESLYIQQNFDLILLCRPDIPYENDDLRENPEDRDRLFEIYLEELENSNCNYVIIESDHNSRVNKALSAIEKL